MFFAAFLLCTSCFSSRDIEIKDFVVDNVSMQGSKIIVDFSAVVHNPNRAIVIQHAAGEFSRAQKSFAAMQLLQTITIPAKSKERCSGQIQLTLKDLFSALQMGADYKSWDMSSFLFTGNVRVKSGWLKKKYTYKEMPLSRMITNLQ